jgi:hypothetical protein
MVSSLARLGTGDVRSGTRKCYPRSFAQSARHLARPRKQSVRDRADGISCTSLCPALVRWRDPIGWRTSGSHYPRKATSSDTQTRRRVPHGGAAGKGKERKIGKFGRKTQGTPVGMDPRGLDTWSLPAAHSSYNSLIFLLSGSPRRII